MQLLGTTVAPSANQCQLYSSVTYKVYYSKMGYSDNPQNFIVDIYQYPSLETWTFNQDNSSSAQTFEHYVSIQYIEISSANLTSNSFIPDPV